MPTILTHPAVPLAVGLALGRGTIPPRLLLCGVLGSVLPDFDVLSFLGGIAYGSGFGHRGFSHSLLFAALAALAAASCRRWLGASFRTAFLFLFAAVASHGVLDAFTNGGMGVAFLWPWSELRHFAPVQVIEVSPLRLSRFLSPRGWTVLKSEWLWVWLPALCLGLFGWAGRTLVAAARNGASSGNIGRMGETGPDSEKT